MATKITTLGLSMGLSVCLGITFAPLGCGSTQEAVYDSAPRSSSQGVPAPGPVVAQFQGCLDRGADRLTGSSYGIMLEVTATEDGHVRGVKVKSSMLTDHPGIESCMVRALEGMSLPASVTGMRSPRRVSGGVVAPESRALAGTAAVLGGAVVIIVELLPIVVVAVGVTVIVGVTIDLVTETITSDTAEPMTEKERCRKVVEACLLECNPYLNSGEKSGMPYHKCLRECKEAAGCWKATNP